jgi:thymidylate kinase
MGRRGGLFITLDGPSGVGKTTVGALVAHKLQSRGTTVICDRYMPYSLVFDPLDGVEHEFVRAIYRRAAAPDIAFILFGDPHTCFRRAVTRGYYSRFHAVSLDQSEREAELFHRAAACLQPAATRCVATTLA